MPKSAEDRIQIMVIRYLRLTYPWALAFHVPNGGKRNGIEGAKFKKMGVLAGVSDILILEPIRKEGQIKHLGLAIELKNGTRAEKKGKVQYTQKEFLRKIEERGWKAVVCYGFDHARETIDQYLNYDDKS